ncbi:MAG TPA: hypothetical protein VNV86_11665, partial [Candidatus Acidoferrum sp.]|nr:hypothetical protein [Candidatus Acidoferrum sp.]
MSFSNIQQLYSALQSNGYLSGTTFNLPGNNVLGSTSLSALLNNTAYFPASTLAMTGVTAPAPTGSTIVITGSFAPSFLGSATPISTSAILYLDGSGNAQIDLVVLFADTWTFSSSFSGLAKTQIDTLVFTAPSFVLASIDNALPTNSVALTAGLNFAGGLSLSSAPLTSLAWLWNSPNFILSGSVTLPKADDIPAMDLVTAYAPTGLSIGTVAFISGVGATSADNSGAAEVSVSLTGQLDVASKAISIAATIPASSSDQILLTAGSLKNPLASLNDLAALVSGQSLSSMIPSQIPLGNSLQLVEFTLGVVPSSKTITQVTMVIGLVNLNWTIVPNVVQFQDLLVTFTIAFPVTSPTVLAVVNATFTITSGSSQLALPAAPQQVLLDCPENTGTAVIGMGLSIPIGQPNPQIVFSGGLQSGAIDLVGVVGHFFGSANPIGPPLVLTAFDFQLDVTDKTYSVNATVCTGNYLTIDLGPSIPFPTITIKEISLALQRTQTGFGATIA